MSGLGPEGKRCRDCGKVKAASEFWRRKQSPDGLALYCKECFGARNAERYRKQQVALGKTPRTYRRHSAVPDGMKYCANCAEVKPLAAFGRNRADPSGLASYCKPCHNKVMADIKAKKHGSVRSYHLKRRYGLTEEQVVARAEQQGSLCLICLRRRALHVDHDHSTGEVRGLICFPCNGGLGQFEDRPDVMRLAVDYLEAALSEHVAPWAAMARRAPRGQPKSRRHYRLTGRYGIGEEDVERLIERQGGLCSICRKATPDAVDHDHVTGVVRGILCGGCNTGMGQLDDNPWLLRRAVEYLTGGLSGLRRTDDGRFEVTIVRARGAAEAVDPGWDVGQIGGHDLAVLHAFARGDSGDPWEFDVGVADPQPTELRFAALDLRGRRDDAPRPARPADSAEYLFS